MAIRLVQVSRGSFGGQDAVESTHFGSIAVVDGKGALLKELGSASEPVHLRSTTKPFQLLPLLRRNIHTKAGLSAGDLALLMSSHSGEDAQVDRLKEIMSRLGVQELELLCGVHAPTDSGTRRELLLRGEKPGVVHNNCSGKHSAMVAATKDSGWDVGTYIDVAHPLQREIADILLEVSGASREELGFGIDGCSAPTFIMPLLRLAQLYGQLASPSEGSYANELRTLFDAGSQNAYWIAGSKRLDTWLIEVGRGTVFAKTGAEGVYALAVRPSLEYPQGLGIAFKISDGDNTNRARHLLATTLLLQLGLLREDDLREKKELSEILNGNVRNYRGVVTGKISVSSRLQL